MTRQFPSRAAGTVKAREHAKQRMGFGPLRFSYSVDGSSFIDAGTPFVAKPGRWIAAKVGSFALSEQPASEFGYADFGEFKVE